MNTQESMNPQDIKKSEKVFKEFHKELVSLGQKCLFKQTNLGIEDVFVMQGMIHGARMFLKNMEMVQYKMYKEVDQDNWDIEKFLNRVDVQDRVDRKFLKKLIDENVD